MLIEHPLLLFCSIVIPFTLSLFPSLEGLVSSLLYLGLGVVALLVMLSPVMFHAEQYHIVRIIAQPFGFVNRLCRLEGNQVVMVDAWAQPASALKVCVASLATVLLAVADTPLAQSSRPSVHNRLHLCPSLIVEHPHVLWSVSALAHGFLRLDVLGLTPFFIQFHILRCSDLSLRKSSAHGSSGSFPLLSGSTSLRLCGTSYSMYGSAYLRSHS